MSPGELKEAAWLVWEEAKDFPGLVEVAGYKGDENPNDFTEDDIRKLQEAIGYCVQHGEGAEEYQRFLQDLPALYEKNLKTQQEMSSEAFNKKKSTWAADYNVPQSERERINNLPVSLVEPGSLGGIAGQRIAGQANRFTGKAEVENPWAIPHEVAHLSHYQAPVSQQVIGGFAHYLATILDPAYRRNVGKYGIEVPGINQSLAYFYPEEGQAQVYGEKQVPGYMKPFYPHLMYPAPEIPKSIPLPPMARDISQTGLDFISWLIYSMSGQKIPVSAYTAKRG